MTQPSWEPLSVRVGTAAPLALREGVPGFLERKLRQWVWQTASADSSEAEHLLIRLGLELPEEDRQAYAAACQEYRAKLKALEARQQAALAAQREQLAADPDSTPVSTALAPFKALSMAASYVQPPADPYAQFLAYGTGAEILLDVVDALLYVRCVEPLPADTPTLSALFNGRNRRSRDTVAPVARLLEEARSVYEVRPDRRGLRRRIDVTLAEAVERAGAFATAAGRQLARDYLLQAQAKLYTLHPDPRAAYALVILAVEEVVNPFVLPRENFPILSKAARVLRESAANFEFAIAAKDGTPGGVELVVSMLETLCRGQSDRHGGGPHNAPVSRESAETAFNIAVSLVLMFTTGAVRRRA